MAYTVEDAYDFVGFYGATFGPEMQVVKLGLVKAIKACIADFAMVETESKDVSFESKDKRVKSFGSKEEEKSTEDSKEIVTTIWIIVCCCIALAVIIVIAVHKCAGG